MVTETETAVIGTITDNNCMDEVDLETMKIVQEQFLATDTAEIKEISEHSKQVKQLYYFSILAILPLQHYEMQNEKYLEGKNRGAGCSLLFSCRLPKFSVLSSYSDVQFGLLIKDCEFFELSQNIPLQLKS